jgi:hypothetical protein
LPTIVLDDRINDLAEGRADDHADGEVNDVALHGEVFEFRREAHGMFLLGGWIAIRSGH